MEDLIVPSLRMLERILIAGFAGMSIYLGYKLFFHLPTETDHTGSIKLPGIKVVLSKVGPGIFFVAFGGFVLLQGLGKPVETNGTAVGENTTTSSSHFVGATSIGNQGASGLPQRRAAVIERIGSLNCALEMLTAKNNSIPLHVVNAFHDTKISLLLPVWNTEAWGETSELNVPSEDSIKNDQLRSIFTDTSTECLS